LQISQWKTRGTINLQKEMKMNTEDRKYQQALNEGFLRSSGELHIG